MRKQFAVFLCLLFAFGPTLVAPAGAHAAAKQFVDKIHGETPMWVDAEYWQTMIEERWGGILCIAPSHNVSDYNCTDLELIDFYEDPEGNFWVKLDYSMVIGEGFSGLYPYRGYNISMWFGLPCNGGYIKSFVYPNSSPYPIDHEENITDPLPDGTGYVC